MRKTQKKRVNLDTLRQALKETMEDGTKEE